MISDELNQEVGKVMLRLMKIVLVFGVVLWGGVGALHNVMDWQGTLGAVRATTSMSTFADGAAGWQATSSALVVWAGALFIVMSKLISAGFCLSGMRHMWRARFDSQAAFQKAKAHALTGCAVALFMLFVGFIVIAESWYELWRSDVMRGPVLESAFRYAGLIGITALLIAVQDES